jgi:hypothetical protein
MARGGGAQPGAARPPQTAVAAAPTGSFDDGRPNQIRLSIRARQTILSVAAATSTRKRRAPRRQPTNPAPFYTAKNMRLWTGTR